MMQRTLSFKKRFGLTVTALLAALGSALVIVSPAAAATVERVRFVDDFAVAYTNTTSADGCLNRFASVFVGNITTAEAPVLNYDRGTYNSCTGESQFAYGSVTTDVFDFSRHAVHAVATVPLSDGTEVSVDLTWQGTGAVERNAQTSRNVIPGQLVARFMERGARQQATVTGTESFDHAYIATSKISSLTVNIDLL